MKHEVFILGDRQLIRRKRRDGRQTRVNEEERRERIEKGSKERIEKREKRKRQKGVEKTFEDDEEHHHLPLLVVHVEPYPFDLQVGRRKGSGKLSIIGLCSWHVATWQKCNNYSLRSTKTIRRGVILRLCDKNAITTVYAQQFIEEL